MGDHALKINLVLKCNLNALEYTTKIAINVAILVNKYFLSFSNLLSSLNVKFEWY
jgi:hypothetical protein